MSATATVVYEAGADDAAGGSSARGVESISRKENLQKIATSAGVEASDVSSFFVGFLESSFFVAWRFPAWAHACFCDDVMMMVT